MRRDGTGSRDLKTLYAIHSLIDGGFADTGMRFGSRGWCGLILCSDVAQIQPLGSNQTETIV